MVWHQISIRLFPKISDQDLISRIRSYLDRILPNRIIFKFWKFDHFEKLVHQRAENTHKTRKVFWVTQYIHMWVKQIIIFNRLLFKKIFVFIVLPYLNCLNNYIFHFYRALICGRHFSNCSTITGHSAILKNRCRESSENGLNMRFGEGITRRRCATCWTPSLPWAILMKKLE